MQTLNCLLASNYANVLPDAKTTLRTVYNVPGTDDCAHLRIIRCPRPVAWSVRAN